MLLSSMDALITHRRKKKQIINKRSLSIILPFIFYTSKFCRKYFEMCQQSVSQIVQSRLQLRSAFQANVPSNHSLYYTDYMLYEQFSHLQYSRLTYLQYCIFSIYCIYCIYCIYIYNTYVFYTYYMSIMQFTYECHTKKNTYRFHEF